MLRTSKCFQVSKSFKAGSFKTPFSVLCRALILRIIEYDIEVYFNSIDGSLQLVEKIEIKSLQLWFGALQHTPILTAYSTTVMK